jgi:hypothetical protein
MLHGLRVGSAVTIEGVEIEDPRSDIDLEISVVDHLPSPSPDVGEILAYDFANGQTVRSSATDNGSILVSFSDISRFRISPDRSQIELDVRDPDNTALAGVLLQGWVMSMTLMLRGCVVLHASAVEVDGSAIAVLANSGMGKSTVAAMLMRDGAELLTDDVLRVENNVEGLWVAHPGITALRLRPAATELAHSIPGADVRSAPDDRVAVLVKRTSGNPVALAAVIIPFPSRSTTRLEIKWLDPSLAAVELNQYPRVYDWKITDPIKRQFEATGDMATDVPVGLMSVPWGPPWPSDLLGGIVNLLPTATR